MKNSSFCSAHSRKVTMPGLLSYSVLLIAIWGTCIESTLRAQNRTRALRAAATVTDITPSYLPIRMAGSMRPNQAQRIHDPLKARILVLDNSLTTLVLGTIDNCVIPRSVFDQAKLKASALTGIPTSHMMLSATHTHSAPPLTGLFLNDGETDYLPLLIDQIAKGIVKTHRQLEPAQAGWTKTANPRHVHNRRWHLKPEATYENPFGSDADSVRMNPGYGNPDLKGPAGPTDPDVSILAIARPDGSPLCIYANYSLHYVGGVQGLSADYFGAFASALSLKLKSSGQIRPCIGILSNGASGDINNLNYALQKAPARKTLYEQIQFVANDVADSVMNAMKDIQWHSSLPLKSIEREIPLGVRKPEPHEMDRIHRILKEAQEKDLSRWSQPEIYARESLLLQDFPDQVAAKFQVIQIGDLGIMTLPTETFAEIGLQLKNDSPFGQTMIVELANGYNGYLPTPQQHAWGGYETWRARSSYLERQASIKITDLLSAMAHSLHSSNEQ
ncbi:hypothetical protein OAG74_00375 [Verrucomicrobia bacterium]|nr:hypothetical protein [Verrucomicrobiota bacterium]